MLKCVKINALNILTSDNLYDIINKLVWDGELLCICFCMCYLGREDEAYDAFYILVRCLTFEVMYYDKPR